MDYIGTIGSYQVFWNSEEGTVWVGDDECNDTAESEDGAMEVAQTWIERYSRD